MKGSILLIADGDAKSDYLISRVAKKTGRQLRRTNTSADAFRALGTDLSDVDAVIIDLDSGIQALLILEILARNHRSPPISATAALNHPELPSARNHAAPPIIAMTGLNDAELPALACEHGATVCLHKPLDAVSLTKVIEQACRRRALFRRTRGATVAASRQLRPAQMQVPVCRSSAANSQSGSARCQSNANCSSSPG